MELKFEELNTNEMNETLETTLSGETNGINYTNYWSNANQIASTNAKKKQVSYDDILSSLNMVVTNGVLQFAKPTQSSNLNKSNLKQTTPNQSQQKKQVTIKAPTSNNQHHQQQHQQNNYITNKYFKDYKDESTIEEEPPKPMTKEEYKKLLIQDYINRQQAQRRISEIKSKKLLFNTQHINIAPTQNIKDMNKLFKSFKR